MPQKKGYKINPQVFIGRKEAEFRTEMLGLPTDTMYNNIDFNIKDNVVFAKQKKNTFSLGMSNDRKRFVKSSSKSLKKKAKSK